MLAVPAQARTPDKASPDDISPARIQNEALGAVVRSDPLGCDNEAVAALGDISDAPRYRDAL
jgi:hypothetical protein